MEAKGTEGKKPYLVVILIQVIYAGMVLFMKAAFNGGMNTFIFVFYRQAAATIIITPLAVFFEWKSAPPMTFLTFIKMFFLSFFGIALSLDICGVALDYTSATLVAATTNSLPVITFILAVLLSMEVLRLRTAPGIAKVIGMLFCIAGVVNLAFVKGPHFKIPLHLNLFGHHDIQQHHVGSSRTWVKGCFLMLLSNTLWGFWLVVQGQVTKNYPPKLLFTAFQCLFSSVQTFAIAIALERDLSQWKLGWNLRLLAVAYCGFVVSGVTYYLQTWVIEKKGPVFLSMSTPLSLIITMFFSAIFLGEIISMGSLLGGLLLVGGLYWVLWAKSREEQINKRSSDVVEVQKDGSELKEIVTTNSSPALFGVA
ncbi:WAT1-related protein At5g64700 [Ziziphus jujuba]|uniref:WAT1-related protein n=2 Tax=Ziziphus jujuba TaxID=326968 RepID=A0ABM3ISN8_ZIZJJ|nr:WAT1-related protein At5g64700 [Ziziphus jujuba]KAH7520788.1 hypothetical protein FEM48_Zijuj08G0183100 [Ziziphus jujuba var. spinosa]